MTSLTYADISVSDESDFVLDIDYRTLGDDDDRENSLIQRVTLTNDGSSTETVSLALSGDSSYTVGFESSSDQSFTLSSGESREVDIGIEIDLTDDIDGGTHEDVFTLSLSENSGTTQLSYDAEVVYMLDINKVYFEVNSQDDYSMDDGDSDDGDADLIVTPGDEVVMTFSLENLFDEDYKRGDLDIEIKVELDEDDFGKDIDEEIIFTLDPGKKTDKDDLEYSITFDVPEDADEDDGYNLEISFEAKDENGAEYKTKFLAEIEVKRQKDDIKLNAITLSQTNLVCGSTFSAEVEVANFGSNNQENAALEIFNTDLGISERENFVLNKGSSSSSSKTFKFEFEVPEDISEGEYSLEFRANIDLTVLVDRDVQKIIVGSCSGATSGTTTTTTETNVDGNNNEDSSVIGTVEADNGTIFTIEKHYSLEDLATSLIIVFVVLVALSLVLLVILGASPRRRR